MVLCPKCGLINDEDAKYCEKCGESIQENVSKSTKSIIIVGLCIILMFGIAFGVLIKYNSNSKLTQPINQTNNTSYINHTINPSSGNSINISTNQTTPTKVQENLISASEARKIAKTYILEPEASAGTPKLVIAQGKQIYIVPIIVKGQKIGELYFDAQTGRNLGAS